VVFNAFLIMIAVWVGITRTADYEHHATDVIAGGVLGLVLGVVIYRLYYPSIFQDNFASRAWPSWLPIPRNETNKTSSDGIESPNSLHPVDLTAVRTQDVNVY